MVRRGPEKIALSRQSSGPTLTSFRGEADPSPGGFGKARSLPIASTGEKTAGAHSDRATADWNEGPLAPERDRPAGVRGAMASRLG